MPTRRRSTTKIRRRLADTRRSLGLNLADRSGELALLFAYLAAIAFVIGVGAPCLTMTPKFGEGMTATIGAFFAGDNLATQRYSLLGGIWRLFHEGDYGVGSLLLTFSLIFPVTKLALVFMLVHASGAVAQTQLRLLGYVGKWSMLDVFVIAAMVICFKSFPGGTRISGEWGLFVFATSVVLSMLATHFLKRHLVGNAL